MKLEQKRKPGQTLKPRARCKTRKRRFPDEISAKIALSNIRKKDSSNRDKTETRVYYCKDFCRGWHLTSAKKHRSVKTQEKQKSTPKVNDTPQNVAQ